jgi:hypothetical protein
VRQGEQRGLGAMATSSVAVNGTGCRALAHGLHTLRILNAHSRPSWLAHYAAGTYAIGAAALLWFAGPLKLQLQWGCQAYLPTSDAATLSSFRCQTHPRVMTQTTQCSRAATAYMLVRTTCDCCTCAGANTISSKHQGRMQSFPSDIHGVSRSSSRLPPSPPTGASLTPLRGHSAYGRHWDHAHARMVCWLHCLQT